MSQLLGGGAIETFCPACGWGMRQSPTRPTRSRRWFGRLAKSTFAPPSDETPSRPGFRPTSRNLFVLAAWALLAVAIRALFVGYPSIEPLVFAQLYIWAFAAVLGAFSVARTVRYISGRQVFLLCVGAIAGAVIVFKVVKGLQLLPATWEPEYCADLDYPSGGADFRLPPKTFRCMSEPIALAGVFVGWWLSYWLITRWERAGRQPEAS
jgi:hypothetical protein